MHSLRINKSYYSRELPYIKSVKPYFFTSHSRQSSLQSAIATQYKSAQSKRHATESLSIFKNSGLVNSSLIKKLTSRPGSPVTVPNRSLVYIPSSISRRKNEFKSKSIQSNSKTLQKILQKPSKSTKPKEKITCASKNNIPRKVALSKHSPSPIKISNSDTLADSASHASLDYFIPRYHTDKLIN
jgi:Tfp pilus tip-associated adhesin PilY1